MKLLYCLYIRYTSSSGRYNSVLCASGSSFNTRFRSLCGSVLRPDWLNLFANYFRPKFVCRWQYFNKYFLLLPAKNNVSVLDGLIFGYIMWTKFNAFFWLYNVNENRCIHILIKYWNLSQYHCSGIKWLKTRVRDFFLQT